MKDLTVCVCQCLNIFLLSSGQEVFTSPCLWRIVTEILDYNTATFLSEAVLKWTFFCIYLTRGLDFPLQYKNVNDRLAFWANFTCGKIGTYFGNTLRVPVLRLIDSCVAEFYRNLLIKCGHAVAQSVEAQRYKSEGRGFDYRWAYWNFSCT
jgi:hypothetical protein